MTRLQELLVLVGNALYPVLLVLLKHELVGSTAKLVVSDNVTCSAEVACR
jgi:hypothetical protein